MNLEELATLLHLKVQFDFSGGETHRAFFANHLEGVVSVELKTSHLIHMLHQAQEGSVSYSALSDWAAFVYLSGLYSPEGETEEERWAAGDGPTWDVLQRLMTPSVFGILDQFKLQEYISLLERHQ
jgi:hypothetical protein